MMPSAPIKYSVCVHYRENVRTNKYNGLYKSNMQVNKTGVTIIILFIQFLAKINIYIIIYYVIQRRDEVVIKISESYRKYYTTNRRNTWERSL